MDIAGALPRPLPGRERDKTHAYAGFNILFLGGGRKSKVIETLLQRRGAADDFGQLGGDRGLAGAVVLAVERFLLLAGRIGCGFHGHHPGELFADHGIHEGLVQRDLDRLGQQFAEQGLGLGRELVDRGRGRVVSRRFAF